MRHNYGSGLNSTSMVTVYKEPLKSIDETLAFDHSNESHREVFSCVSVHYILQGGFDHKPLS